MPETTSVGRPPLVGITGHRRFGHEVGRMPTFVNEEPMEVFLSPYVRSVARAGGLPVLLTREAEPEAMVEHLDALVLAGGEDVDPRRYGAFPPSTAARLDPGRDEMEIGLFTAALAREIPILGICRGCQLINVARGGTLLTDLPIDSGQAHAFLGYPGDHRSHDVAVEPGSVLADLVGDQVKVNSYHHQAVDALGNGVQVTGRAEDGVVEAIELPGLRAIAVQWHPEMFGDDPVFRWLVEEAGHSA